MKPVIDSHCHLDRLDLGPYNGDLSAAVAAAHDNGVSQILCVGIDAGNAQTVVDIAEQFQQVYASVGFHPLDVGDRQPELASIEPFLSHPKVVAVGETGMDYYYSKDNAELQQFSFAEHLKLAGKYRKPVIVHTRDAREDTLSLIRQHGDEEVGGVLHCFTESWEMASQALDLNYCISFSGIITFKNAAELREVVKQVPLSRMLIETDAPYLAPVPFRGKKNEPKYVTEVAKCVAEIKGVSVDEVAETTSSNFAKLFF
jgi:TatD DNase family protein